MKDRWAVKVRCEVLQVSVSGYFRWLSQSKSQGCASTRLGEPLIVTHMRAIHLEVKGEYGWPRMQSMSATGMQHSINRLHKLIVKYST